MFCIYFALDFFIMYDDKNVFLSQDKKKYFYVNKKAYREYKYKYLTAIDKPKNKLWDVFGMNIEKIL